MSAKQAAEELYCPIIGRLCITDSCMAWDFRPERKEKDGNGIEYTVNGPDHGWCAKLYPWKSIDAYEYRKEQKARDQMDELKSRTIGGGVP